MNHDWSSFVRRVEGIPSHLIPSEIRSLKKELSQWPGEIPRPIPNDAWKDNGLLKGLCLDVKEVDTYNLYLVGEPSKGRKGICNHPSLTRSDGTPAVMAWRQGRGSIETMTGARLSMGMSQPGLADIIGFITVETPILLWDENKEEVFVDGKNARSYHFELEVKLLGHIPPGALEYKGTSQRKLTATEQEQVRRQKVLTERGCLYAFVETLDDAVAALVRYRNELHQ